MTVIVSEAASRAAPSMMPSPGQVQLLKPPAPSRSSATPSTQPPATLAPTAEPARNKRTYPYTSSSPLISPYSSTKKARPVLATGTDILEHQAQQLHLQQQLHEQLQQQRQLEMMIHLKQEAMKKGGSSTSPPTLPSRSGGLSSSPTKSPSLPPPNIPPPK